MTGSFDQSLRGGKETTQNLRKSILEAGMVQLNIAKIEFEVGRLQLYQASLHMHVAFSTTVL